METTKLKDLDIQGEKGVFFIPHINFNADTGHCVIEGESYLENTWEFYKQLVDWIKAYAATGQAIEFDFRLTYFNTSSSKGILELLEALKEYQDQGGNVTLKWYYPKDDEDILEEAEDFVEDTQLDIELIAY